MVTDVFVVYNDDSQIKRIGEKYTLKYSPFFTFINESSNKCKKEAYALKNHWGARLTPFAICLDGDKVIRAFYSETGEDIIKSLIDFINSQVIENENISIG